MRETLQKVSTTSHRQAASGISNCQESVVVLVPKVGGTPCQLRPAPVLAVVVRQGAVVHHRGDVGEHALQGGEHCCFQSARAFQLQTKSHLPLPGQVPKREQDLSQAQQQSNGFAAQLGMEGRKTKSRLIFYIKLILN